MTKSANLVFLLFTSMTLFAQVSEEIKVILRQVRVHVVDENGEAVKGLSKDDFLVRDQKKYRTLSTFEETDLNSAQQVLQFYATDENARPKTTQSIIILIDSSNLSEEAFEPMLASVQGFIENQVGDQDLVKVVQIEDRLRHLSEFTSDKAYLQSAVGNATYAGYFRRRLSQLQARVFSAFERMEFQLNFNGAQLSASELRLAEGLVDEVMHEVENKELEKMVHMKSFRQSLSILARLLNESPGNRSIYLFTGGSYVQNSSGNHVSTARDMDELARVMNASGVTLYSFLHTTPEVIGKDLQNTTSSNFNDSVRIQQTLESFVSRENRGRIMRLFNTAGPRNGFYENESQIETGPLKMAHETGGFFARTYSVDSMAKQVQDFTKAARHFYTLGYTVDPKDDFSKVDLELVEEQKGWKLIYGDHVANPKPFDDWSDEDRQLAFEVSLLYGDSIRNDLDAEFGHTVFRDESSYVIPMYTSLPNKNFPKAGYELGLAVFDENDRPQDVIQMTVFPRKDIPEMMLYHVLLSDAPPSAVKFYMRDLDSGELAIHRMACEQVPSRNELLQISSIVLSNASDKSLIPLNHIDEKTRLKVKESDHVRVNKPRRESDPFVIHGVMIAPRLSNLVPNGEVDLYFHVTGMEGDMNDYEVRFNVSGNESKFVNGYITTSQYTTAQSLRIAAKVDLSSLSNGDYQLNLQVLNPELGLAAVQSRDIQVSDSIQVANH